MSAAHASSVTRVPAHDVETLVINAIRERLRNAGGDGQSSRTTGT